MTPTPKHLMHSLSLMVPFALVAGGPTQPLPKAALQFHRAQQPQRTLAALDHLQARRAQLGLGDRETFRPGATFTNASGEAIVRLDHLYEGYRVVGSQAIAKVPFCQPVQAVSDQVIPGVKVSKEPALGPEKAIALTLGHLGLKGALAGSPRVERVVFPAAFLGGPSTQVDPASGRITMRRDNLVHARLAEPFVWAYEVKAAARNPQDGLVERTYTIDARTGAILRINDDLRHEAVPSRGTGRGLYSGTVPIPTSLMTDGTYALFDPTRGSLPNPFLGQFTPDGSGWGPTGLQVWYEEHTGTGQPTGMTFLFQSNPLNTWGDGAPFSAWGAENGANGQTAGVDAHFAMAQTWDMLRNVFGREGVDGKGTTVFAQVLATDPYSRDNASWSPWNHGLILGAGSYPGNPEGLQSLTELDIVAHEMTHGLTASTAQLVNAAGFEEAGLDEGTSDFFGQMAKAYASRPAGGSDAEIPATGADWRMGVQAGHGTPIRWMDRPSKDHRSVDGWYDGLAYMDGHFSAGVLGRALYFLSNGASATAGADDHSVYLPQGMQGIGNDKAAHIWFKTLTERLYSGGTGSLTFAKARRQAIQVAKELYGNGWDCPESIAVENAFGAVNVGRAYAEPPRTQVLFADWRDGDWIERHHFPDTGYAHKQYFPMGVAVWPKVAVLHAPSTEVTWSLGGPSVYNNGFGPGQLGFVTGGGSLNADGSWTTPMAVGWFAITATSKADPRQFAEGRAFIINMDSDTDQEQDAVDLGPIAFSWYLTNALNPAHSMFNAPWVDDADVAAFVDALKSTWWNK